MKTNIIVAVVVALLVSAGVYAFVIPHDTTGDSSLGASGGAIHNVPDVYTNGVGIGNDARVAMRGTIGPGKNQGSWTNRTGKTVYVDAAQIGYPAGTASSSLLFYATSTVSATTITSDYTRPSATGYMLIDGASVATSTVANPVGTGTFFTSTSTSAGAGEVAVPNGGSLIFQVQEKYACKADGTCTTATSTNRGIANFTWFFTGHYALL